MKRILKWLMVAAALVLLLYVADLWTEQRDYFLDRRGTIAEVSQAELQKRDDGAAVQNIDISSDTGLEVRLRLLLPAEAAERRVPLLLLLGGHRTGKHAVDLITETQGIAYAAIDYPYQGRKSLSGLWQNLGAIPHIQSGVLDTPPALMLATDWLLTQPWIDKQRTELLGISLGVPFAAVAGGLDVRFSRVWLIHGSHDNLEWLQYAGRKSISNELLRKSAARAVHLLFYGNSFDTRKWIDEISPRSVVIVAARDDERVPESSRLQYIAAAEQDNISLIWTDGLHIGPRREHELQQLVDIVVATVNSEPDRAQAGQDL